MTALFTYGEGFHNFHHQFAIDYRNGIRAYHFDPSKWIIRGLSVVGLTRNLKSVSAQKILQYRLNMEHERLLQQTKQREQSSFDTVTNVVKTAYDNILQLLSHIEGLEKNLVELKQSRIEYVKGKMSEYRLTLIEYQLNLKKARRDLKQLLMEWASLMRSAPKKIPA